ncbi:MAG TPA: hypothetical protein VHB21_02280 [Minicystis sp.]|nr:hypothetical protein [Minicystis sp.]
MVRSTRRALPRGASTAAIAGASFAAIALLAPPGHAAGDKKACAVAYDATQAERQSGKLILARQSAAACTNLACPEFIRRDCAKWLEQIDAVEPSVVLRVRRGQEDLSAVAVELDGQKWLDALDGRATPIDPGHHVLRFSTQGTTVERALFVVEGEKNRLVDVDLDAGAPAKAAPEAAAPTRAPFVVGGAGVAFLVAGGVMTGVLVHLKSVNDPGCTASTCDHDARSAAATGDVLGPITTVSFVAGAAGVAAGAIWFYMTRRRHTASAAFVAPVVTSTYRGVGLSVGF